MKKLLLIMGCFTATILITSCTAESIETDETNTMNDIIHPLPSIGPPPLPPSIPSNEHGDDDRDKDKVKG